MLDDATLRAALGSTLLRTELTGVGTRHEGKVRDLYLQSGRRVLIATDRLSAFDRILGTIPYKGQVLNQLAAWWFEQTADIVANHVEAVPDPNVTVGREAEALPVEVVVRGYITGVTSTALWTRYAAGDPEPYGLHLPAGLRKNERLPEPVITPTTKGGPGEHDERLTSDEVVSRGLMSAERWAQVRRVALALYARGVDKAAAAGLVLVDTKYEFGLIDGELVVIDEIHTPDSSRYWKSAEYATAFGAGVEPEGLDKEYVRRWLAAQGYTGEGDPPALTDDVRVELARRYIAAFEQLTGGSFSPAALPAEPRIATALQPFHQDR